MFVLLRSALMMPDLNLSYANREKVNKGIGIENVHYLNDGLWHMKTYKWRRQHLQRPPIPATTPPSPESVELLTARHELPVNCLHLRT